MARREETAFERDLRENLQDPEFREVFVREARRISVVDRIINQIDEQRDRIGMSKAELARAIGRNPAVVRRLLTADEVNPRFDMIAAMADAVGLEVGLVPRQEVNNDDLVSA
jgi:ribosome-binding protein aMBF1 (putative translation factor)